ncbi:4-hydroxy-tetrahydrodipicolinate synthase [Gehongia tenuis]|uniref:4-hydroxy-tetrahydrodipicolinate synthase n=1 Tax=Gehongia tenuis TaxID=2763655 RepID=A0A926D625_9FIRM|nr:4-hydroxy-tetrahydrodipicolinate synthase [Gehongia tenuis]MBC8531524.1 4-hydroxy-tetrahydrodipicolinate synthase [Gehongia tenuis]
MSIFTGSGTALVTPFTADGKGVNFDALEKIIDFQLNGCTDALIITGTTGEASTMTSKEKLDTLGCAIDRVKGKIPVIAGTGNNNTAQSIENSLEAQKMGADGVLIVTPYYNKATQEGLIAHYTAIAEAIDIPVIVYNVPSRTGLNIAPATMARLGEHKNIRGIKEASGNIAQIVNVARSCRNMDLYSGNDDQVVPILSVGGKGVISVVSNVAPKLTHDMVMAFLEGDTKKAMELQYAAADLSDALFCEVNPIPVKAAMAMMGFEVGPVRLPLTPLSQGAVPKVEGALKRAGLI